MKRILSLLTVLTLLISQLANANILTKLTNKVDTMFTANDPVAVANDFWILALSDTPSDASKLVLQPDQFQKLTKGYHEDDRAIIGSVEQQEGIYYITTQVILYRPTPKVVNLLTVVNSTNGQFRVDAYNTLYSFYDAITQSALKHYQDQMTTMATQFELTPLSEASMQQVNAQKQQTILFQVCQSAQTLLTGMQTSSQELDTFCFSGEKRE